MRWTWFRERPRTRSWAWDGVHVEAQNKDKVVGVGRSTHRSPRHFSCLLLGPYQTGCNDCDDCGGPRINAMDWATQVSQQSKGCGGAGKKGHWPGYSMKPKSSKESWPEDWLSKQGVLTRFIGWAMNKSRPDGTTDKQMDIVYCTIFEQMKREPVTVSLNRIGDSWSK